ncbi:Retrovirus-related Pol polyprotein from transposon TNT 1-94 [Vitis vinifera]|uniref:Retrovirus-related Pol polyprotein from transposon TNT 1-94 n=1 Tax=Vitis vinifera TaxID=29760 RepID=A0A438CNT8_VITVI|nr:Retrovirus-related Pol polyprotein from transposon TNT 1-94 [Vitis vinifera]
MSQLEKLEFIYSDVCGPMDVETLGGNRTNRTILEKVRCMLKTTKLPKVFWGEATQIACYLINRSPSSSLNFEVPEKAWT